MHQPPIVEQTLVVFLFVALATVFVTRRIGVPFTLGLVVVGLVIAAFNLLPGVRLTPELVLDVFLPGLLFEGAWSLEVRELKHVWGAVVLLVGPGLLLTAGVCTIVLHVGAGLSWGDALLLSAILAPTDPVAVLGLFRELNVGMRLRTTIEAESLLNDGLASVLYFAFLGLVLWAAEGHAVTGQMVAGTIVTGIVQLALAGVALGAIAGFVVGWALRWVDEPLSETTVTLVAAYGVYFLAADVRLSGILAVVTLGLILGYFGRHYGMQPRTQDAVDSFWTQVAFLANALLFLLIGAQINVGHYVGGPGAATLLATAGWAILAVLGGRACAVYALRPIARSLQLPGAHEWPPILLWAGLRGALSLALALALPLSLPSRDLLIAATYGVVLFTLLVQGLTLRFLLRRLGFTPPQHAAPQDGGPPRQT